MKVSMDGKGCALDDILTERFWRTLKYENVYLHNYETRKEARAGIDEFIWYYNTSRPHQSLGYATPSDVYFAKERKGEG